MSNVFAHGQLRLYLLALLADGPRHGYDLIRDVERTFDGLYSPSAGTVYPRLAKLEDEGLVERSDEGRKTPYTLTAAGQAEVVARAAEIAAIKAEIPYTVAGLADQVRARVSTEAADLRAELTAAAAAARAQAAAGATRPTATVNGSSHGGPGADQDATGTDAPRGRSWQWSGQRSGSDRSGGDWPGNLEWLVNDVTQQLRDALRRGVDSQQAKEIGAILLEAAHRIREVLRH